MAETVRKLTPADPKKGGIQNLKDLADPAYLSGSKAKYLVGTVDTPGGPREIRLEIGPWKDEPNDRSVSVTFYDESFGRVPLSSENLSYAEFYRLLGKCKS